MISQICQLMLNTYQMCYPCPRTFVTYVPSLYRANAPYQIIISGRYATQTMNEPFPWVKTHG